MNKGKMVKIAVVSVLAVLLLAAVAVSMARYDADQLRDSFLKFCVVAHVSTICLLAWFAATAPTPASRSSYAKATATSCVQLALNLYLVLVVGRAEVQEDTA